MGLPFLYTELPPASLAGVVYQVSSPLVQSPHTMASIQGSCFMEEVSWWVFDYRLCGHPTHCSSLRDVDVVEWVGWPAKDRAVVLSRNGTFLLRKQSVLWILINVYTAVYLVGRIHKYRNQMVGTRALLSANHMGNICLLHPQLRAAQIQRS